MRWHTVCRCGLLGCLLFLATLLIAAPDSLSLTQEKTAAIGWKVFLNETGGNPDAIVWWGAGEDFASVGIGHFLWMPKGYRGPFDDSFRAFLRFSQRHHVVLPAWLSAIPPCPWHNRRQWLAAQNDPRMKSLKSFLLTHKAIQSQFIVYRFTQSVRVLLRALPPVLRERVKLQIHYLMASEKGQYALVDYVNFKGTGLSEYQKGNPNAWGLLQVLDGMKGHRSGDGAVEEFADCAKRVLQRRVKLRPQDQQWLAGWMKRIDTYTSN